MNRFKQRDEFSVDEEIEYRRNGTVPEIDDDERAALEDAGFDPDSKRPLAEVEAEQEAQAAAAERNAGLEAMTCDEHLERIRARRGEA